MGDGIGHGMCEGNRCGVNANICEKVDHYNCREIWDGMWQAIRLNMCLGVGQQQI